jgi:cell division protein ZapE
MLSPESDGAKTGSGMNDPVTLQAAADGGPRAAYRRLLTEGRIEADPQQAAAVERLQSLHDALKTRGPRRGFLGRLLGNGGANAASHGLYLVGAVGRGKSMLMDLFFAGAPVARKRRVHFNEFMVEVHDRLHRWRRDHSGDPIPAAAAAITEDAELLCFDEFQVTNIADAMLLGRLVEALMDRGVTIVATSNWAPKRLYEGGLQRDRFLPCIALLEQRLDVIDLGDGTDWRRIRVQGQPVYFVPHDARAEAGLAEIFRLLTGGGAPQPDAIENKGRTIAMARAAEGVAWSDFDALCRQPLGASDYLAIAGRYHALLLENVPVMTGDDRNEALRFVALIDALYEHRTLLAMSAAAEPDALCEARDVAFSFRRTASRLVEMRSAAYLAGQHRR